MKMAIRKHWKDFAAVIVLMFIAAGVGGYILSNQRFYLPKWVPVVGSDFYTLNAEFSTAQAVTPGQGQSVDIAGVKVGEISKVDLVNGRAVVQMKIKRKYSKIYNDATILLRPKTGLKDMILELDPGTATSGTVKDNGTIPVSSTLPDINADEILAQLDGDTRDYLRVLLAGAGQGLKNNGTALSATFRRFEPTARDGLKITQQLATRRSEPGAGHPQLQPALPGAGLARRRPRAVRLVVERRLRAVRRPGLEHPGHAPGAAAHAPDDVDRAGEGRSPRPRARPDAAGVAPDGAQPRPDADRRAPVPARDDSDHPRSAPALLAGRPARGQAPAPGGPEPLGTHA
jgi:hypothetical protein